MSAAADKEQPAPSSHSDDRQALASTEWKVRGGFAFALICLGVIGMVSYLSVVRLNENAARVQHADEILSRLELLLAGLTDSETAERGYVITADQSYLAPYSNAAVAIDNETRRLQQLTADNSAQQQRLESLLQIVNMRLADLRAVIELRRNQGFEAAQRKILTGQGKHFHDEIRSLIDKMKDAERSALHEHERAAARGAATTKAVIVGGSLLALAFVGLALVVLRRDFAGRARAETALRSATEELERFFSLSLDFLCIASADGYFKRVSPAVTDILGWSPEEFFARPFIDFVHPDDRDRTLREVDKQMMSHEKVLQFENRYRHKDGSWRVLSWRSMPAASLMYASARDVTELRRAEASLLEAKELLEVRVQQRTAELEHSSRRLQLQLQRLNLLQQITRAIGERQDIRSIFQVVVRTLEEQLPVDLCSVCLYDEPRQRLVVTSIGARSEALARQLSMADQMDIEIDADGLSHSVRGKLTHEPDLADSSFPFSRRLAGGGLRSLVAAPLVVESKVFGVLIAARRQPRSFSSGECEFLRQLSEHVALAAHQAELYGALQRAYDDLRQTQMAVMQQERLLALGQMASGIAHDINNAISPVALYTESLLERESDLNPRARSYLETIKRAIEDVAQTVARMREFYRQRESQASPLAVDLNGLVPQVVDLTRARWSDMAQQRGVVIEVRTELAANLPAIMGAESEIREALINLIFNAIDAMPEGGRITLRTSVVLHKAPEARGSPARGVVQLEVIDSGIGMDEETQRRCLEPFFTTKGERGTGLGLAMVYGAMQRHHAEIEIESSVGRGTTMRLSFPIPDAPAAAGAAPSAPRQLPPLRILVVDDDPLVLKSLSDALEGDGHFITRADGGQAGIAAFLTAQSQGNPFPVVITDLGMPHVDGRKVSAAVKTAAPGTIVLMLTGWGQQVMADGEPPAHVDRVLSKPPKMAELREAMATALGQPAT